jgi:hypothetical protein
MPLDRLNNDLISAAHYNAIYNNEWEGMRNHFGGDFDKNIEKCLRNKEFCVNLQRKTSKRYNVATRRGATARQVFN